MQPNLRGVHPNIRANQPIAVLYRACRRSGFLASQHLPESIPPRTKQRDAPGVRCRLAPCGPWDEC